MVFLKVFAFFITLSLGQMAGAETAVGRSIGLAWEKDEKAIGYELRFERIGYEEKPLFFKTKTTEFSGVLQPGEYRFYLRAYDRNRTPGEWSEPESVAVSPLLVTGLFPNADEKLSSKDYPSGEIEFRWERGPGDKEYEFKLANEDNSFVKVLKTSSNSLKLKLPPGDVYRWSVQAFSSGGTPGDAWEQPSTFTYMSPQLAAPMFAKDASYGPGGLAWSPVPGAKNYSAELRHQEFLSEAWFPLEKQINIQGSRFEPATFELKPGKYKLLVTAHAEGWLTSKATEFTFVVKPVERELASIPEEISSTSPTEKPQ